MDFKDKQYSYDEILDLPQKIALEKGKKFIVSRFADTGKKISEPVAQLITQKVDCHPYYVQQLSQLAWLRTKKSCDASIVDDAFESLVGQLSLLFSNLVDSLTAKQISFLQAVAYGEKNFSSREVLTKYQLGTSANIKNLKKAMLDKDLIDVMPDAISLQDPVFAYWLKEKY